MRVCPGQARDPYDRFQCGPRGETRAHLRDHYGSDNDGDKEIEYTPGHAVTPRRIQQTPYLDRKNKFRNGFPHQRGYT